eukprot:Seg1877.4 transcript_id=Seg1877.4/GoldUCD/mRNA.D3Y31 product="KICSTOR complex protein C12orf66-like" protein_id=Seg1877.4/GoldUCD/D3Y31
MFPCSDFSCSCRDMAAKGSTQHLSYSKEALLEVFFYGIGQFMFDPAKEIIEREKEISKTNGSIWSNLFSLLYEFTNAEKLYYTLTYIERRLLRRDVVRPLYERLQTDLRKIEAADDTSHEEPTGVSRQETMARNRSETTLASDALSYDLAKQLSQFIAARKEMIDFYAKMAKNRWENREGDDQLVQLIENITERHSKEFHHPILDSLKTSFSLEIEIVKNLFKAELEMQRWNFFPALLLLYECQANLNSWSQLPIPHSVRELSNQASAKSPFLLIATKKNWQFPFLYQWLYQVHLAAVSKFSLYFYTTLSSQTNPIEMKMMTAKTTVDYFAKIITFIKKSDAFNVSLVLDTNSMSNVCSGHGYFLPNIERDRPTGMDTYPAIVSLLDPKPTMHWPNVISLLHDKSAELATPGRTAYCFDEKLISTYYLIKLDVRIYMVVIFNGKKKERDSYVLRFMTETRALLCYERNYQMLKPRQGQKFRK